MNKKEIELRKNTLENKLKDTFITDFHLEDLTKEEREYFLKIALQSYLDIDNYEALGYIDLEKCFLLSSLSMQNFHILKSIKVNNDKLDTLIQQNTDTNNKLDTLIELLSKK